MTIKYGKSFKDIINIKQSFFKENDKFLDRQNYVGKVYSKQPKRKLCKACEEKLPKEFIISHNVKYTICKKCSHLNGLYQDSDFFCNIVYNHSAGQNYADRYFSKNLKSFNARKNSIYDPKAKFLVQSLGTKCKKMKILDVGAGSGYLLSSFLDLEFKDVEAIEPSEKQVNFGKKVLSKQGYNENLIKKADIDQTLDYVKQTKSKIITMIGVLEHLNYPREMLSTIRKNKNIQYIFLSVPLYSLSVLIESCFQNIHNRHLGGSHTHLFTEKSLKRLLKSFGFTPLSEWWFGTDFMDLMRSIHVTNDKKKNNLFLNKLSEIYELVDDFQKILDQNKLSSEVHIVFKRK